MAKLTIEAKLTYAWWWPYYLMGVVATMHLTGCRPDMDKVGKWHKRACTVEMIRVK
tara:strand:- start:794 stop:961 length:168 start_codon:yes stop_codon:yes gene_type:complete